MGWNDRVSLDVLVGETVMEITGMDVGSDRVEFTCASGRRFVMYHSQDCCESVQLNEVIGTVESLIGSPITMAREDTNADDPGKPGEYADSWTWTFYNFATVKGYVTLRWLGESNGYYGEGVDFEELSRA